MHFRTARGRWTPTDLERARLIAGMGVDGSKETLRARIRQREGELARCAGEIRALKAQLRGANAGRASGGRKLSWS